MSSGGHSSNAWLKPHSILHQEEWIVFFKSEVFIYLLYSKNFAPICSFVMLYLTQHKVAKSCMLIRQRNELKIGVNVDQLS